MPPISPDTVILAIDPGTRASAYVKTDATAQNILSHGKVPNKELLNIIASANILTIVAIEMVMSYGMPVGKDVFETCVWIGQFIRQAEIIGLETLRITRLEAKMAVCHSPKARDSTVRQRLIEIYGKQGTKDNQGKTYGIKGDEWSALAIALTASTMLTKNSIVSSGATKIETAHVPIAKHIEMLTKGGDSGNQTQNQIEWLKTNNVRQVYWDGKRSRWDSTLAKGISFLKRPKNIGFTKREHNVVSNVSDKRECAKKTAGT